MTLVVSYKVCFYGDSCRSFYAKVTCNRKDRHLTNEALMLVDCNALIAMM